MSFYQKHVFLCTNERHSGKKCCQQGGASTMKEYLKSRLLDLGIHGPGKIRVSSAGCMGRCSEGPMMVVYPEGIWYSYLTIEDLNEIIDSHLIANQPVKRLIAGACNSV